MSNPITRPKSAQRLFLSLIAALTLLAVAAPAEAIIKVTKVTWLRNPAWKIEGSANGVFYFEAGDNGRTGFSSAIDLDGKDWILNDGSTNMAGMVREYRGFPNLGNDNFNHPQRNSNSTTRWVGQTGTALGTTFQGETLVMESSNAMFAVEYHFFASHIAIKMVRAGGPYSFLFEGPIGGVHEPDVDWIVGDSDAMQGTQRVVKNLRPNGLIDPAFPMSKFGKYFYMGDPVAKQVFFVAKTPVTPETDEGWGQGANMTITSFGRGLDVRKLTGTANVCTFGFLNKADGHPALKTFIDGTLTNPFQPAGGGQGGGGASGTGTGGAGGISGSGGRGGAGGGGASTVAGTGGTGTTGTGGANTGSGGATAGTGGTGLGTGGVSGTGGQSSSGGSVGTGGGSASGGSSGTGGSTAGTGGTTGGGTGGGGPAGTGGRTGSGGGTAPGGGDTGGCAVVPRGSSLMSGFAVALLFGLVAAARRRRRE